MADIYAFIMYFLLNYSIILSFSFSLVYMFVYVILVIRNYFYQVFRLPIVLAGIRTKDYRAGFDTRDPTADDLTIATLILNALSS